MQLVSRALREMKREVGPADAQRIREADAAPATVGEHEVRPNATVAPVSGSWEGVAPRRWVFSPGTSS